MDTDSSTSIYALWVPVLLFAHAFAAFWLWTAFRLQRQFGAPAKKNECAKSEAGSKTATASLAPAESITDVELPDQLTTGGDGQADGHTIIVNDDQGVSRVHAVELEWQALGCSYPMAGGAKIVLEGIWGRATPGQMQALLGPSGAGKSTLLDMLAQRKSLGELSGRLLVNGQPVSRGFIRRTAYVPQAENFIPTMTTAETLRFYAAVMLPPAWNRQQKWDRCQQVLALMGLADHHGTLVGGELPGGLMLRGLSGGERKRLCIATGVLAAPSVVFLDEPTSGLDSFAALTVMGYLKRMARENGQVVISSIHQPRSAIWAMFDAVTLLASGRLVYTGPREGMCAWLSGTLGYEYDPALHGVASDWALDLVATGFHKPRKYYGHTMSSLSDVLAAASTFRARYLADAGISKEDAERVSVNSGSSLTRRLTILARAASGGGSDAQQDVELAAPGAEPASDKPVAAGGDAAVGGLCGVLRGRGGGERKYTAGWWAQYVALLWREVLSITRNPADVAGRTLTFAWVALIMGLLYFGMPDNASSLRSRQNLLFNVLAFFCLMPYVSMSLYTADKKFYIADASAKLYRPLAYYLAKVSATLPFHIISSCVFAFVVYGMAGLRNTPESILMNAVLSTLLALIAVQVLHLAAIIAPNQDVAFMCSIIWTTVNLLLSSFFVTWDMVTFQWLTWFRWLSALYYAFEGVNVVEFSGVMLDCSDGVPEAGMDLLREAFPNSEFLSNRAVVQQLTNPGADCVFDCNAILTYFNFTRSFWPSVGILTAYWVVLHVFTFIAMLVVVRRERR